MKLSTLKRQIRIKILAVIIIALAVLFPLFLRFNAQLYTHFALNRIESKEYKAAAARLEQGVSIYTSDPVAWKNLGYVYFQLSETSPVPKSKNLMKQAKTAYLKAHRLNPLDAQTVYGLARTEARLEQMFGFIDKSTYNARPFFEESIRLRPNSILYHSALARYYHYKNDKASLLKVVADLAYIYPKSYAYLKREKYWSSEVKDAIKNGLQRCIDERKLLCSAHGVMSSLMADEKKLDAAIYHHKKSLDQPGQAGDPATNLRLADFYLEQGKLEAAEAIFWRVVSLSEDREGHLKQIAGIYTKNRLLHAFEEFYNKVNQHFLLSRHMDIMHARILIDLDRLDEAKNILERLNREEPTAEAYYELYRIAEKQKDRDAMILALAEATIQDRTNVRLHQIFSRLLVRANKLEKAEREADLAIRFLSTPSAGLYAQRADIRWKRENYIGAAEDYAAAAALKPANANLHARTAAAYEKAGDWERARQYYAKAAELDPENKTYQERLSVVGGVR